MREAAVVHRDAGTCWALLIVALSVMTIILGDFIGHMTGKWLYTNAIITPDWLPFTPAVLGVGCYLFVVWSVLRDYYQS